ncbi:MAG: 16S rRNA (adenine(1518)-N(6)/adenine(1519)-N(6))-dimethyltransferase RsmA [Acidimicrobiia bacterium]|nr:16S rRNA (adenine(1518)-N(6)/adenine(1519)-N(6))-dimethyltransferase RsmA [Acidimicrobiia bacterium]
MTDRARPQGRREIIDLLARHDRRPRKALGQHFLADPNIVDRIVRLADCGPSSRVVEIGAGTGTLTRALGSVSGRVVAYEVDQSLQPLLDETLAGLDTVEVRFADAMAVDFAAELPGEPWVLVANLPYNVGTPLILDLLRSVPTIERFVVMVQREVAERLAADPGSRRYGLPSVTARLYATVQFGFSVPPQVFVPPPDVESAVVVLERRAAPAAASQAEALARAAFGQRRKMLRRSLTTVLTDPEPILLEAGIESTARAEELTVEDFVRLAETAIQGGPHD